MSKRNKKPWTLVEHLRGLGIEPEAPWHPAWEDLGNHWGSDFIKEVTLTQAMLDKMKAMSLPAAPLAVTLYKWAAQHNVELNAFKGTVNSDPRVRQAMCEYATARITANEGFTRDLDDLMTRLMEQGPLPEKFRNFLDDTFNQQPDTANTMTAWIAPFTEKLPAISTWPEMAKSINASYPLNADDLQMFNNGVGGKNRHWSQHYRMELVLAAWLETDSHYLAMPLYNHLPNVSMDNPDDVTAVFWMVAMQHIDMNPHSRDTKILDNWTRQHAEYRAFLENRRVLIENIMGDDPVVCGKLLNNFWHQRNAPVHEQPVLAGLLEP